MCVCACVRASACAAHAREHPRIQIPRCNQNHTSPSARASSTRRKLLPVSSQQARATACKQRALLATSAAPALNLSIYGNKLLSHANSSRTHTLTDLAFNLRKAPKLEDARNTGQRTHAAILFRSVATQSSVRDPAACGDAQQMRCTRSGLAE